MSSERFFVRHSDEGKNRRQPWMKFLQLFLIFIKSKALLTHSVQEQVLGRFHFFAYFCVAVVSDQRFHLH